MVSSPQEITADWLASALGRRVTAFTRTELPRSTWAEHVRILAQVEGSPAPLKLRVKLSSARVFGRSEVDYYLRDFIGLADAPLVRCHHAEADDEHYCLVLDDLSDSHSNQDDVPVTEAYGTGLVESLGKLHGHRWTEAPGDPAAIEGSLREARLGLPVMIAAMEDGFSAAERARVAELFDRLPAATAQRTQDPRGFAWDHGDPNPGNILAPKSGAGPVLLIDHQPFADPPPAGQLALSDLAYGMVLWWPEQALRDWAPGLVRHWNERLRSQGFGYQSADLLRRDWELCVMQTLRVPAGRCSAPGGVDRMRWLWEREIRRILAALANLPD